MIRNIRLNKVVVPLAAFAAILVAACPVAQAQVKPFKVTGGGIVDFVPVVKGDAAFHDAVGTATHLGKYDCLGLVRVDKFTSPTTAEFSSAEPCVFTAANGDQLVFHYGRPDFGAAGPGVVELFDAGDGRVFAVFIAEFNPVPALCTGRFAKVVDGSFIMVAVTEPFVLGADDPVAYTREGDGWIEFGK